VRPACECCPDQESGNAGKRGQKRIEIQQDIAIMGEFTDPGLNYAALKGRWADE
jgi:hypothetical protein